MKERYIDRINKLGKYAGVIVNALKGLAIAGIVVVVLLYLFLDLMPKGNVEFKIRNDLYVEIDLSDFGFVYSEVDEAEQKEYGDIKWKSYEVIKESFGEDANKGLRIQVLEAYTTSILHIDEDIEATHVSVRNVDVFLVVVLIYMILIFVTLVFVRRFFKALQKEQSPFGRYVISNMLKFTFSLIPWGLISPSVNSWDVKGVGKISVTAGVNVVTIFVIIALFGLVYVFKYGALLQQESDETL